MSALDLTGHLPGAPSLWLHGDGTLSTSANDSPTGMKAADALTAAARWISSRRTSTFETLFPDDPKRHDRLSELQARGLLRQLDGAIAAAAVDGNEAKRDPLAAAELRSAALTVLSHLVATALHDRRWRAIADPAAARIFALIAAEQGAAARPALRAHAVELLRLRGPALSARDRVRVRALLRGLTRAAPPYAELPGPWHFGMCNADDFHDGECDLLREVHHFREIPPAELPPPPPGATSPYRVFQAPFHAPDGTPIQIWARVSEPTDENLEMASPHFVGLLVNRHSQLGIFDLVAASVKVRQAGYKLMMTTECNGLATRYAISRIFPDADIYSSWDATNFETNLRGKVVGDEGTDCFVAVLRGMSQRESHVALEERIRKAQKTAAHPQARQVPGFVQFVGPSHPLVIGRTEDLNSDGKADLYDGFLDFELRAIAERVRGWATPRDPKVAASRIGGDAALGLDWAAQGMNRVAGYSDFWRELPGGKGSLYAFEAAGFYSHREPPEDVPTGAWKEELGRLPSVCRYRKDPSRPGGLSVEVMFHSWLSQAPKEYKRLLVAAEGFWRALDLGWIPRRGPLASSLGQRGELLLMLAGLLEFPADQNGIDALWAEALHQLRLPAVSRSLVAGCITQKDHDQDNYYGGVKSLARLVGEKGRPGALAKADPVALAQLASADPAVGRARALELPK